MMHMRKLLLCCLFPLQIQPYPRQGPSINVTDFIKQTTTELNELKNHKPETLKNPFDNINSITIQAKVIKNTNMYSGMTTTETGKSLTQAEKTEQFKKDTKLIHKVQQFAQGVSDTVMQSDDIEHFKTLSPSEKEHICTKYLKKRSQSLHEDLLLNKKQYLNALNKFETQTLPQTKKTIHELEKTLKDNDYQIIKSKSLLQEKSKNHHEKKHHTLKIAHVSNHNQSIEKQITEHINILKKQLKEIDETAMTTHHHLLTLYKNQDQIFITTIESLLSPTETITVHLPTAEQIKINTEKKLNDNAQDIYVYPLEIFKPDIPLDELAENPQLPILINNVKEALENEKASAHPRPHYITYFKDELAYLEKALLYKTN